MAKTYKRALEELRKYASDMFHLKGRTEHIEAMNAYYDILKKIDELSE